MTELAYMALTLLGIVFGGFIHLLLEDLRMKPQKPEQMNIIKNYYDKI